jgi:predicted acyl esterase
MRLLAVLALAASLWAAPARAASGTVAMDDGVRLAYDLHEPAGKAPRAGWPGVVVMHGLGGSKETMASAARFFADRGYAALAFSVRGQGTSRGAFDLAGPRDVADMKTMVGWLERRPEVSGRIGCFGISLGGGECWNATPSGIFDAVVPVATWTDLQTALFPGEVARSGVVASLASAIPPALSAQFGPLTGRLSPLVVAALAQRSVASRLGSIRTPVYLCQGRLDYVFDVDQATTAFARLAGPRKLYVGDFGHPPSAFASPDFPRFVLEQSARWFDRFLKGDRNGIERPAVALADRTGRRRTDFPRLPATRVVHAGRTARALETFGASTVTVRVRRLARFPRLVAVVSAGGRVVTHGAVVPHAGLNTIRLADYVVDIAKGARVTVRLDAVGDPAYFSLAGPGRGTIRFDPPRLDLRVLR